MARVSVATLKAELSKYLEIAQAGEPVIVTSYGEPIAKIGPAQTVTTPPMDWAEFRKNFPGAHPKKKGTSAARLIRKMRDEE